MARPARDVQLGLGLDQQDSKPLSTAPFYSEAFFEKEKEIWRKSWLSVGRMDDLRKPGDFITFDIKIVHASIVVIMGRDMKLRAFHNICAHRANRVVCEPECKGNLKRFLCRFHSWTYDLDGRLMGVPDPEIFPGMKKEEHGMSPVSVDHWGGFIFINLDPTPKYSLAEWVSGTPDNLGSYLAQDNWRWYTGYKGISQTNWKHITNGAHDGYHGGHLHRNTFPAISPMPHEFCKNSVFPDSPGLSSLLTVMHPKDPAKGEIQVSPLTRLMAEVGSYGMFARHGAVAIREQFPGAMNPIESERWIFDMWTIFPNHVMLVLRDMMYVFRAWPLEVNKVHWEFNWFFRGNIEKFSDVMLREHSHFNVYWALPEDIPVGEWVQESLRSGAAPKALVGNDMEATVRALHEKLLRHLGMTEENLDEYA